MRQSIDTLKGRMKSLFWKIAEEKEKIVTVKNSVTIFY